jgi:RNA recognition motif-containing protein
MEVFIGNLSSTTTLNDVMHFFKGFAKKARFRMVNHKLENGGRSYYAVADFDNDKLALKAIKRLNGGVIRGEVVVMREFIHRSYNNERRAVNWRDKPWNGPERRRSERREKVVQEKKDDFEELLKSSKENAQKEKEKDLFNVSAYGNMARKL